MRNFVAIAAIALVTNACTTVRLADGTTQRFAMVQVGVVVRVLNNCTPFLDLERVGGMVVKGLPYGESATIPLVSTPFGPGNREMPLTAKGYSANMEYLGSVSKTFYVSTSEGSREEVWEIDRLNLPGGRGGCS